ncbi:MAG: dihydrolipoyl dehydrogenase [Thermodesulfobacteriota bacterium]
MTARITILGAGPGGYVAAIRAAQLGAEVTLIERDNIGGVCLNWGCIPTKTIKTTTDLMAGLNKASELGLEIEGRATVNLDRLMRRKKEVIEAQTTGILKLLKSYKVRYLRGHGHVLDAQRVRVEPATGGPLEIVSDKLILATGSRPLALKAFPFDGRRILSSSDALNLQKIPASICIVGGGVIGCEFAFIFAGLGSRVVVVEALARLLPLPGIDQECSKVLEREMKKRRIQFLVNRVVEKAEIMEDRARVTIAASPFADEPKVKNAPPLLEEVETVLVSIGRDSNARGLGLEALGLEMDDRGWIAADARMETNIPGVYAIGDALGPAKVMLAHVASAEGLTAAENALGAGREMNYDVIPSAVFTTPEVGCVGLTEELARARGRDVRSEILHFRGLGKAQVLGEIAGHVKIVADRKSGRLVGVHIIGPHATDLIAEGTLAVRMGATLEDLASTIHAHPTLPEALMEVAHKALGAPIHSARETAGEAGRGH